MAYVSNDQNTCSHTAGVRRARSEISFCHWFLFAETVPTSYRKQNSVHKHASSYKRNVYYKIGEIRPEDKEIY